MRNHGIILCAGPFPAIQRTLRFDQFQPGAVNRALDVTVAAAGKPINVARAILALGGQARVTGFKGGETGRLMVQCLRRDHVPFRLIDGKKPTRICDTCLDTASGTSTELVEESLIPPPRAWADWFALVRRLLREAGALVLSGTLPAGAPADTWRILAAEAQQRALPVFLDSQGEPLFRALSARPWMVKPNAEELVRTLNLPNDREPALWKGMARLQQEGAQHVLVTRGNAPTLLLTSSSRRWRIVPPRVQCRNPIGCGDTVTGVLALSHLQGRALPESARRAVGAATARCRMVDPGAPSPSEIARWEKGTIIRPLGAR